MKLTNKIQKALDLAIRLHAGQTRKTDKNIPYSSHVVAVAWILSEYTDDENIIVAGLLHDVLEDVPREKYDEEKMREDFGDEVTDMVKEVSEDKDASITKEEEKATWIERKQKYLDNLKNDSYGALMVCSADKIHNLRSMAGAHREQGDKMWEKFNSPADKKIWFYEEVYKVLKDKLNSKIFKELEKEIATLSELIILNKQSLFIGFIMDKKTYDFDVCLINNSGDYYKKIKVFTGAYVSVDDDLLETSKVVRDKGQLSPYSAVTIDKSDWDELDYVIWYHIDLVSDNGKISQYWFQLPKYGWGYDENLVRLPIIAKQGMIIELEKRDGEPITEEIKTIDMNSKYHKSEVE